MSRGSNSQICAIYLCFAGFKSFVRKSPPALSPNAWTFPGVVGIHRPVFAQPLLPPSHYVSLGWSSNCKLTRSSGLIVRIWVGPDGQVPVEDYELPIGQAEVVQEGTDDAWLQVCC